MQFVEMLYKRRPEIVPAAIRARAQQLLGHEIVVSGEGRGEKSVLFVHTEFPIEYKEGFLPAQTALLRAEKTPSAEEYRKELQQSWNCENAAELLAGATETVIVTEMMARLLPAPDRLKLFHGVLQSAVESTMPDALVFKHSQQIVAPSIYLGDCDAEPLLRRGSVNVRFFRIEDSDGEMLMDTRGLHEIGLHDLQCHYRKLEPNDVSRVLFNLAGYLVEKGPVIKSGNTVEGARPGSKWKCQFERAILEPDREVLDLNPGKPFAAGNR